MAFGLSNLLCSHFLVLDCGLSPAEQTPFEGFLLIAYKGFPPWHDELRFLVPARKLVGIASDISNQISCKTLEDGDNTGGIIDDYCHRQRCTPPLF